MIRNEKMNNKIIEIVSKNEQKHTKNENSSILSAQYKNTHKKTGMLYIELY